ncbi:hypothetical protein NUV26_03675, partial [Burkholderia pseudomultivorans]|uniref:hypothetical protein n=1 Tax=Burkholderia pseudomultivorans TaxID=1207504 RepID=UPI002876CE72
AAPLLIQFQRARSSCIYCYLRSRGPRTTELNPSARSFARSDTLAPNEGRQSEESTLRGNIAIRADPALFCRSDRIGVPAFRLLPRS